MILYFCRTLKMPLKLRNGAIGFFTIKLSLIQQIILLARRNVMKAGRGACLPSGRAETNPECSGLNCRTGFF